MALSQQDRLIRINDENFIVLSFSGDEAISSPFSFELLLATESNQITFDQLAGKNVTVSLHAGTAVQRYFNGMIVEFEPSDISKTDEKYSTYRALLTPNLWALKHCIDSRIFQEQTTPQIIEKVLNSGTLAAKNIKNVIDFRMDIVGSYPPRAYCVQYNESDLAFINRLCQDEGLFYYFEHTEKNHTLVFCNDSKRQPPFPGGAPATVTFHDLGGGTTDEEVITSLRATNKLNTGKYVTQDFNFTVPENDLMVTQVSEAQPVKGIGEHYEYPGGYEKAEGRGKALATVRRQAMDAHAVMLRGRGNSRGFMPGTKFGLKEHPLEFLNGKAYLLLKVRHEARQNFASGAGAGDSYFNVFTALPIDTVFRPERQTPKPVIAGSQTAIVKGPKGEEIYTDPYGRVKVKFHWDRNPDQKTDENLTCWIRVSQVWAGANYGAVYTPRVGQEVIINFLEGDPDRPIIAGRVYNGVNHPPFDPKVEKTKSTLKSNSSKNGESNNNEILFEDLTGREQFHTHAAKDRSEVVENDKTTEVKNNQKLTVQKNRSLIVVGNETVAVRSGQRKVSVGAHETHTNQANYQHTVSGNYTLRVNGNITIDASGTVTLIGAKVIINP